MIKSTHLVAIGAAVFLFFCLFLLPAASVLNFVNMPAGFTHNGAAGSLWSMRLNNVAFRGTPVGNVYWSPNVGIIFGALSGTVRIEGPTLNASFDVSDGPGLIVENLQATAQLRGRMASQEFSGGVRVVNAAATFDRRSLCLSASGELRTNAFEDMFATLGMARNAVTAPLVCRDGFLTVDFVRPFSGGTLEASAQLRHANGVALSVLLRFENEAAIPEQIIGWLESNGFSASEEGWQTTSRLTF